VSTRTLIVVDDFFPDPDAVRREALRLRYHKVNLLIPWYVCLDVSAFTDLALARIAAIMGEPLFDAIPPFGKDSTVNRFGYGRHAEFSGLSIHSDPYMFAGVLYLHPEPAPNSGTSFYRQKATGRDRRVVDVNDRADLQKMGAIDSCFDYSEYELQFAVPNVYNRLIIFDATMFHTPQGYFGTAVEDARLYQTFSFNLGRAYRSA
jgi:hypothetical protein